MHTTYIKTLTLPRLNILEHWHKEKINLHRGLNETNKKEMQLGLINQKHRKIIKGPF